MKNKLKARDAENFQPLKQVANIFGEEAVNDLEEFIKHVYIPQSKYSTMFSIQEDLIIILDEIWREGIDKAHLTKLRKELQSRSMDYKYLIEKEIASYMRSLGFGIKRDKKGKFVEYNSHKLDIWRDRYLAESGPIQSTEMQDEQSTSVAKGRTIIPGLGLESITGEMFEQDSTSTSKPNEANLQNQHLEEDVDGVEDVRNKDIGPKEKKDK